MLCVTITVVIANFLTISLVRIHHQLGGRRVECSCVLVEQQHLCRAERRHDQRQRLTLTSGEQRDAVVQALLKAQLKHRESLVGELAELLCDGKAESTRRCPRRSDSNVFDNRHVLADSNARILKHARQHRRASMHRPSGDFRPIDEDATSAG